MPNNAVKSTAMTAQELRQQRGKLVQEMHDLTKNDATWNAKSEAGKFEAQERWAELNGKQEALKRQIEAIEASEKLSAEMEAVKVPPQPQIESAISERGDIFTEAQTRALAIISDEEYRKGFVDFVRTGSRSEKFGKLAKEARTYAGLSTGSATAGETLIPVGFQRELEETMKMYGGMRRNCRIVPTSTGNALHWPTVDDTANQGRFIAEAGAISQTNPTFGEVVYNAYLASSDQVLVSVQLLQDSAFNIESELAHLLGIRLGRLTEAAYTTGGGTTLPTGLITSILADSSPLTTTASGSSTNDGVSTNTGANSIGSDDLAAIIAQVDPSYRVGAKFMAHWSIIDYLKKVKDKYGRPLFVPSVGEGQPDKIFGYPYDWNAGMDAAVSGLPAASKNTVLFGDFSKYIIRDVLGMTLMRFNELYMANHQVGFSAFLRTDGLRLQQKAFSLLVQHS